MRRKLMQAAALALLCVSCSKDASNTTAVSPQTEQSDDARAGFIVVGNDVKRVEYKVVGQMALIDDDFSMPLEHIFASPEAIAEVKASGLGLATNNKVNPWPNAIVPFKADPSINPTLINQMVNEYRAAGVSLVPHSNEESYVDLRVTSDYPSGYSEQIGFKPGVGAHRVYLNGDVLGGKDKSLSASWLLLHEVGHALGAIHEQAHPDAEKFYEPVKKDKSDPFEREEQKEYGEESVALTETDSASIMFYCREYKPKQGFKKSVSTSPACPAYPKGLSSADKAGFNRLYEEENKKNSSEEPIKDIDPKEKIVILVETCMPRTCACLASCSTAVAARVTADRQSDFSIVHREYKYTVHISDSCPQHRPRGCCPATGFSSKIVDKNKKSLRSVSSWSQAPKLRYMRESQYEYMRKRASK